MKRDMDLIRELLLQIESHDMGVVYVSHLKGAVSLQAINEEVLVYHLDLMKEAGLIHGRKPSALSTVSPWIIERLTWEGHEFLDTIRDPDIWKKTKNGASTAGSWTIGILKDIGTAYAKQKAQEYLGLSLT